MFSAFILARKKIVVKSYLSTSRTFYIKQSARLGVDA